MQLAHCIDINLRPSHINMACKYVTCTIADTCVNKPLYALLNTIRTNKVVNVLLTYHGLHCFHCSQSYS